jgi:hypothetical protein
VSALLTEELLEKIMLAKTKRTIGFEIKSL